LGGSKKPGLLRQFGNIVSGMFAHNLAKLSLARAIGGAAESLPQFLKLQ
jgi:hypothetical protein